MASMVAMAMAVPMAIGEGAGTGADVNNVAPSVCEKSEVPNPVMPNSCPDPIDVTIKACVCDLNGNDDIVSVTATVTDPASALYATVNLARNAAGDGECTAACPSGAGMPCVQWIGTLTMQAWDPAGNYQVVVVASDGVADSAPVENTLVYQSLIAMTASDVGFGALDPGETSVGKSSTVTVFGNEDLGFTDVAPAGYDDPDPNDGIVWSDMISGANSIPDDQITTAWDPTLPANCIAGCDELAGPGVADVPFTLVVPTPQAAGAYVGTITFTPSVC